MIASYKLLVLATLLAVMAFNSIPSAVAQPIPQAQQEAEQLLVQKALLDARDGKFEAISKIKEDQGDKALHYFAAARFDPDAKVRDAVTVVAGDTYNSLLFLLPMMMDDDPDISASVASSIIGIHRPQVQFQRLNAVEVVRLVKTASQKNPGFIRRNPEILLLLAQFKQSAEARSLVNQIVKANQWDVSTATATTPPVKWSRQLVVALSARCEIGSITSAQVIKVLSSNVQARSLFVNNVNLIMDETLLRYAISLLQDTAEVSPGGEDVDKQRVCDGALLSFSWATGTVLDRTFVNGVPTYNKKDIENLYKFYGLKMQPSFP